MLNQENRIPQITQVLPGSPAAAAGLHGPLRIHKIDDTVTDGLALQECVAMLRGAIGTKVRLELSRPTEDGTFTVELIRQKIAF